MYTLWIDLTFAARRLRERLGFTFLAVSLLSLGIAVTSILFSAIDALVLRPLPVADPESLVEVLAGTPQALEGEMSYSEYKALEEGLTAFDGIAVHQTRGAILKLNGINEAVPAGVISPVHFQVLGILPILGDYTALADSSSGPTPVVVISYAFWRRRFESRPDIVGHEAIFNGTAVRIVAVADPDYRGLDLIPVDVWFPMESWLRVSGDTLAELEDSRRYSFRTWGRLASGRTLAEAQSQMDVAAVRLNGEHPQSPRIFRGRLASDEARRRNALAAALFGPVALVIVLIPCANVAGLLLIQAWSRRREIAIRTALGARKTRIVRQLFTESVLLALLGVAVGLVITAICIRLLPALIPPLPLTIEFDVRLDHRTVAFASAMSVAIVAVCSLLPMRQVFGRNQISLTSAASAEPHGRWRINRYVVTLQIAASVALLSTAGLLARSYSNMENMTPGFNPDPNVLLALTIPRPGQSEAAIAAYYRQLRDAVVSTPGVMDVALARTVPLPMEGGGGTEEVRFSSEGNPEDKPEAVRVNLVEPNYFKIVGIPFVFGGAPSENRNEVVINATMAQLHWRSRSPVGDVIRIGSRTPRDYVITGVAADGKYGSLHEPARPYLFIPYSRDFAGESWLVVQTRGVNAGLRERLHAAVQSVSSESAVLSMLTLADHHSRALYVDRLTASSVFAISIVATILAVVGLYGVLGFSIHLRRKDLAIHMALGASRDNIVLMIFKEGMWLAVLGTVIGAATAWGLSRIVRGLLYGVEAGDPLTLGVVSVCILAIAAIASVIPARRAAAAAPASSLRQL